MKRRSIVCLSALLVLLLVLIARYCSATTVLRPCRIEPPDPESQYVVCTPTLVTGFEWRIQKTHNVQEPEDVYCIITGPNPHHDLPLNYEFTCIHNRYIFYVESELHYYSQELGEDVVEYAVSGWDILPPVRHMNPLGTILFPTSITSRDT